MNARYTRLHSSADGESHFEEIDIELVPVAFASASAPLDLSSFLPATQWSFLGAQAGWIGDWHPSSARNLFVILSGTWELEASDGETRTFGPRDVVLAEDTTGKGHRSRVLGDSQSLALLVQLPE